MIDSFVLTSQGSNVFVIINDQAFISISKQIPRANTYKYFVADVVRLPNIDGWRKYFTSH